MAVPDPRVTLSAEAIGAAGALADPLDGVFEMFPLEVRFAGRFELGAPWGLAVPEGLAVVCAVAQGHCLATADTATGEVLASAGDVFLLLPGADHQLRDVPSAPLAPPSEWLAGPRPGDPLVLRLGSPPVSTVLVGGVVHFDDPRVHPFCWGLPPVVHLGPEAVDRSLHLRRLLSSIDAELSAGLPGRMSFVKRLVEMLFIETARLCLVVGNDRRADPIGQLLHPDLGQALALIHRQPQRPWTVAELAERVPMSRSAFAAAFVAALGQPPLHYLRQRRMELAGRLLRNPSLGLKEIAQRVGYDSVSAFNAAFRRHAGISPGRFRSRETEPRL